MRFQTPEDGQIINRGVSYCLSFVFPLPLATAPVYGVDRNCPFCQRRINLPPMRSGDRLKSLYRYYIRVTFTFPLLPRTDNTEARRFTYFLPTFLPFYDYVAV